MWCLTTQTACTVTTHPHDATRPPPATGARSRTLSSFTRNSITRYATHCSTERLAPVGDTSLPESDTEYHDRTATPDAASDEEDLEAFFRMTDEIININVIQANSSRANASWGCALRDAPVSPGRTPTPPGYRRVPRPDMTTEFCSTSDDEKDEGVAEEVRISTRYRPPVIDTYISPPGCICTHESVVRTINRRDDACGTAGPVDVNVVMPPNGSP